MSRPDTPPPASRDAEARGAAAPGAEAPETAAPETAAPDAAEPRPSGPRIVIDADACPVRDEALTVALRHQAALWLVSNGGIRPHPHPLVRTVIVPQGPDVADRWIAEQVGPGDVCVTADLPLAARCLQAGARVLRHDGEAFTEANIRERLAMRDLMADLRAAHPLAAGGGGKPFGRADRSRFLDGLERAMRAAAADAAAAARGGGIGADARGGGTGAAGC